MENRAVGEAKERRSERKEEKSGQFRVLRLVAFRQRNWEGRWKEGERRERKDSPSNRQTQPVPQHRTLKHLEGFLKLEESGKIDLSGEEVSVDESGGGGEALRNTRRRKESRGRRRKKEEEKG